MIDSILKPFQRECRNFVKHSILTSGKPLIVKAPTGSGKTVIMISLIEEYLFENENTVFVWLCPGSGNLEEQSQKSMEEKCPNLSVKSLKDALASGFEPGDTVFINWELVTNKTNLSISDYEKKNLFDNIAIAHRKNLDFIIIVDEEHSNDTSKAQKIIDAFSSKKQIRMSATAREKAGFEFYKIDEEDVINAGMISKAIVINEDINNNSINADNEMEVLITLALNKRKAVAEEYLNNKEVNIKINPLIIIQFPSSSDTLINSVEDYLSNNGITYENKLLAKWMADSNSKINLEREDEWVINDPYAEPVVLLMKQAISTGWDCPRAKILVKLRDNMDEDFEIQTIGRIRRMPERKHYDVDLLDYCFLYTLDTKYVESVKRSTDFLFQVKKVNLKDYCKGFTLKKELKTKYNTSINIRDIFNSILDYYYTEYNITNNKKENKKKLEDAGYIIVDKIINKIKHGSFEKLTDINIDDSLKEMDITFDVNTSKFGIKLMNAIHHIASACNIDDQNCNAVLKKIFHANVIQIKKILFLDKKEFYAFVINNEELLKKDFVKATNKLTKQLAIHFDADLMDFTFPLTELIKYDSYERSCEVLEKNTYENYDERTLVEGIRSKSERLFEAYIEQKDNIEWIYKNGDSGLQYFSVVYVNSFGKQFLFYPDYIVKKKSGEIWIVETKGGEKRNGVSKNVDIKVENKFESIKVYANKHNVKWCFVRDLNDKLYYNNTLYVDSMQDAEKWRPIKEIF